MAVHEATQLTWIKTQWEAFLLQKHISILISLMDLQHIGLCLTGGTSVGEEEYVIFIIKMIQEFKLATFLATKMISSNEFRLL